MLSSEIEALEYENYVLKKELDELREKMERNEVQKPKSCQYCKNYVQHYIKGGPPVYTKDYIEIAEGHCTCGVPIKKGGRNRTRPDETCIYFELGTDSTKRSLCR